MPKILDYKEFRQLVEATGPFISTTELKRAFPQGFPKTGDEAEKRDELRREYALWSDAIAASVYDLAAHHAWIGFVLERVLDLPAAALLSGQSIPPGLRVKIPEIHEPLQPDKVLTSLNDEGEPGDRVPLLLIRIEQPDKGLFRGEKAGRSRLSPVDRMTALLRAAGHRLGLVTNGEQWTVVYVPTDGVTSTATWYAEIWLEEPVTLRAFCGLVDAHRFYAADPSLAAMLEASALNQHEVTNQLGMQVREAVEILVRELDRIDRDRGGAVLSGISDTALYETAITVMMRLVFLFSAEERGLLLLSEDLYDDYYALSTLGDQLRNVSDQYGEELLERRYDAWARLLASFRAVHAGLEHESLRLPAYGGQLFDPDRYPFLEGRPADSTWTTTPASPLPVNNRTVLHLLSSLQILREKGNEPRRLTFRELDIEQIGHVYESLLDHTARRDSEVVLGLTGEEPEIRLSQLEAWLGAGQDGLIVALAETTGKSAQAIRRALEAIPDTRTRDRIHAACAGDEDLVRRVLPFAALIRDDSFGLPVVVLPGSVYVTAGADRRSTGTHYTPRSLTEPIVQYTLEPLVYEGPAEGEPRENWRLRSAGELLKLKVCDMACGSGAFLVQACRYMADRLLEAWSDAEAAHPGVPGITPEGHEAVGTPDEELIPVEPEERRAYALRTVAQRCLYGVDKNPLAVEMAKLSLWLLTLAKGKPFTFVDHSIKCGDSLLGADKRQLLAFRLEGEREPQGHLFTLSSKLSQAANQRAIIAAQRVSTVADLDRLAYLLRGAEQQTHALRAVADVLVGIEFLDVKAPERERIRDQEDNELPMLLAGNDAAALEERAAKYRDGLRAFHWPLAFPEVFEERGGFDAVIGNPPFVGGQKITGLLGKPYREYLVNHLAGKQRGSADYSAYFFLRARGLLREGGCFGLLATNTIAQGDTREVGLDQVAADCTLIRAIPSREWPGEANLEVAHVWGRKGSWHGPHVLSDVNVAGITPMLTVPGAAAGKPFRLKENQGKSFQGSIVLGMGFIVPLEEARELIARDNRNAEVILPYLNGEDLNSRPDQAATRFVINFRDWPLSRGAEGSWRHAKEDEHRNWLRRGTVPADYPGPVAEDYPLCLAIVEAKVKPERARNNREVYRRRWWQYAEKRPDLYQRINGFERVLVRSAVSSINSLCFVPASQVLSHALVAFASEDPAFFACLQSSIHLEWVHQYASSMRTDVRYTPSDCCETFPFPGLSAVIESAGERYQRERADAMRRRGKGLTATYSLFHDPSVEDMDIAGLRRVQVAMDEAVKQAYGWSFPLDHGFHDTKQGIRFTISPKARQTALDLLLQLNHDRHRQELEADELEKAAARSGPKKRRSSVRAQVTTQGSLL